MTIYDKVLGHTQIEVIDDKAYCLGCGIGRGKALWSLRHGYHGEKPTQRGKSIEATVAALHIAAILRGTTWSP